MKMLISDGGETFGPFESVDFLYDRYVCDGCELPLSVVGKCDIKDWVGPLPTPPDPPPTTAELVALIDSQTDAIYGAVLGNRAAEYELAESEAATYKAAGYPATPPPSVASWAVAKGWTNRQAADDILATAAAWRGAMSAIRAKRLACKQAAASPEPTTRTKVGAEWAGFVAYIKKQLGIPI